MFMFVSYFAFMLGVIQILSVHCFTNCVLQLLIILVMLSIVHVLFFLLSWSTQHQPQNLLPALWPAQKSFEEAITAALQLIAEQHQWILQQHLLLEAKMQNFLDFIQQCHNNQSPHIYPSPEATPHLSWYIHMPKFTDIFLPFTALQHHSVATGSTEFDGHTNSTYYTALGLPLCTEHNGPKNPQQQYYQYQDHPSYDWIHNLLPPQNLPMTISSVCRVWD